MWRILGIICSFIVIVGYNIIIVQSADDTCQCNTEFEIRDGSFTNEFCKNSTNFLITDTFEIINNRIKEICAQTGNAPDGNFGPTLVGGITDVVNNCGEGQRSELGQFAYNVKCTYVPAELGVFTAGISTDQLKNEAASLNKAGFSTPAEVVGRAIKILMAFIGSLTLVLFIWAGILWMTAAGNSERLEKAKKVLVWTTLGLLVMLASYLLVDFIIGAIT